MESFKEHMKTSSQVWMVFMSANMVLVGHVSDLDILRCHLLYCLLKEDYFVDVTKISCHEIYKFVRLEVNQNNQKAKGSLGFPTLIIALCTTHGVEIKPSTKI